MADNTEQIRFLWDLIEEAEERKDALTEATDFEHDRIAWEESIRPRLEQAFGKGEIISGLPAHSLEPQDALDDATGRYDADIHYLQAVRKSLKAR